MTLIERQMRLLEEIRGNPVDRHPQLLPDGSVISAVEVEAELKLMHVRTLQRLGLGTHAEVYEARPVDPVGSSASISIAVKVEKPIRQSSGYLLKEIEILRELSQVGASPLYLGAFTVQIAEIDCLCVGMELFEDSLSSLKTRRDLIGDERLYLMDWLALRMFHCVFKMHDCGFLHRDLKPSNFMYKFDHIEASARLVLIDFGSSISIGEKNDSAFRGTGSYASIAADPYQSEPVDDLWSTAWSVLELSLETGLPWRSISARTEEGRDELLKRKTAMLDALVDNAVEGVTPLTRSVLCVLYDIHQGTASVEDLRQFIQTKGEKFNWSVFDVASLLRPPSYRRLHNRKIPPIEILLNSHRRTDLLASVSHAVPFASDEVPEYLLNTVAAIHAADAPDHLTVDGERVCLTDLLSEACCLQDCPLRHLPQRGIERSAIARSFRKTRICIDALVRKCRNNPCTLRHMDTEEIANLFAVKRRRLV